MRGLALLFVVTLVGCGAAKHLAVSADGRAVLADAYDGHLDHDWSCASLRAAVQRLPQDPPTYSTMPAMLERALDNACDAALAGLHTGASRADVRAALGPPDSSPRCWRYRWRAVTSSGVDGGRVCFTGARVSLVQTALHG